MRERIYDIVNRTDENDRISRFYSLFIMSMALISIIPMMFRPQDVSPTGEYLLTIVDIVTVYALLFDYIMRWITHDIRRQRRGKNGGWIAFIIYPLTPLALLDLLSILPTLVPLGESIKFLRLLRLLKIFRISSSLEAVGQVFLHEGRTLLSVFSITVLFILVTGLILYLCEPNTFSNFIDALYWATSALTTIGYGDFHPLSTQGKLINVATAILGISIVALPTGIITAGYVAETQRRNETRNAAQRAFDTTASLTRSIRKNLSNLGFALKHHLAHRYLLEHPRLARYLFTMVLAMSFDLSCMILDQIFSIQLGLDMIGTAAAAAFLEPAAGIVIGFLNCLIYAVMTENPSAILFIIEDSLCALIFFAFVSRYRNPSSRQTLIFALATTVFLTLTTTGMSMVLEGDKTIIYTYSVAVAEVFRSIDAINMSIALTNAISLLLFDTVVVFLLIKLVTHLRATQHFEKTIAKRREKFFSEEQHEKRQRSSFTAKQLRWLEKHTLPTPQRSAMRERIFEIVSLAEEGDKASSAYNLILIAVAIIGIAPVLFIGRPSSGVPERLIEVVDSAAAFILLFDYFLRWMTHDIKRRESGKTDGWLSFAAYPLTPLAVLDIVSIIPTIFLLSEAFTFLCLLRLTKIFRVSRTLVIVCNIFVYEGRTLFSIFQITIIYVLTTALIMFTNEPDTFDTFVDALYWATTALATIGYGDISPQTDIGKIINICTALFGIIVIALPAGIITGGYVTEMRRLKAKKRRHSHIASFDTSFVEEHIVENIVFAGRIDHLKKALFSLRDFFRSRPRVTLYTVIILLCTLTNFLEAFFWMQRLNDVSLAFDLVGTAMAALLLEPAAGLIVGFVNCAFYVTFYHSIANVNYFIVSAAVAVIMGLAIPARKPFKMRPFLASLIVLLLISLAVSSSMAHFRDQPFIFAQLEPMGIEGVLALIITLIARTNSIIYAFSLSYPLSKVINKLIEDDPLNLRRHFIKNKMRGNLSQELSSAAEHAAPLPLVDENGNVLASAEPLKTDWNAPPGG